MPYRTDPYAGPSLAGRLASSYLFSGLGGLRSPDGGPSNLGQALAALGFVWRHRALASLLVVLAVLYMVAGLLGLVAFVAAVPVVTAVLYWRWAWLVTWAFDRLYRNWRVATIYRPGWDDAMFALGLGRLDRAGRERFPRYRRVTSTPMGDRLDVKLAPGQMPAMLALRSEAIAHTFGALSCRVGAGDKPGWVRMYMRRYDQLVDVVPAITPAPTADALDLSCLHIGMTEDGDPWVISLTDGKHFLIVGESGSGKGSAQMSTIRALCPGIAAGTVRVIGIDPKGGMELAPAAGLFHRFAYPITTADGTGVDYGPMIDALEEAVVVMLRRADALRHAGARKFTPSPTDPFYVVFVDELASLTKYITDKRLAERAIKALSVLLSQGRAPGVAVVASIQDARKDVIQFRDLMAQRVALRLPEAGQGDLVLGDNASKRGAACDQIPEGLPGVGYIAAPDGAGDFLRVRAAYVTDADIAAMVATYAPPAPFELTRTDAPAEAPAADAGEVAR